MRLTLSEERNRKPDEKVVTMQKKVKELDLQAMEILAEQREKEKII